jgi:DNA-binding response OmpR family regulator
MASNFLQSARLIGEACASFNEHSLSFKECSLLQMLIERKNDALRRQDAQMHIWGDDNFL